MTLIGFGAIGQQIRDDDVWVRMADSTTGAYGYRDKAGKIAIPPGKYPVCFTDTFRRYAIVLETGKGIVAIDRRERMLYDVFIFDNGPDDPCEGFFRITAGGKIGYADAASGEVVIPAQFSCAWPFEHGKAKVAFDCQQLGDGEHHTWTSAHWFYIDHKGRRIP